jgi:hypothetical protein
MGLPLPLFRHRIVVMLGSRGKMGISQYGFGCCSYTSCTGIFVSTTMLFGITELVGHFMIHIVLLIFIIEGVSFYKPPISMHQSKLNQMVFISMNFIFVLSTFVLIYYRFA